MEYRTLTEEEYLRRLKLLITGSEGLNQTVEDIGDGRATIGYGYTFNRSDNAAIWRESGIALNERDTALLAIIDNAAEVDRTRLGLGFGRSINAAEGDALFRATVRRYFGPADSLNMPNSDERVAMISLTYNRGVGSINAHPVMDAIRQGDRAEAWFQIRYNCWGSDKLGEQYPDSRSMEGGLRKRRFAEAQVFSLYDDPASVSSAEARSVYRMFQLHRKEIDRVESLFGVTVDGQSASRNRIAEANREFHGIVDTYGRVQTISAALEPARNVLLNDLRSEYPDLANRMTSENFSAGRIYLDPGRDLRDPAEVAHQYPQQTRAQVALRREQGNTTVGDVDPDPDHAATLDSMRTTRGPNPREIDSNDLLIGEGGDDTLRAHRGDDILIGGAGRDRMEGGIGQDTYAVGGGDTVMDSDGHGELRWNGHVLDGGVRSADDPADAWRSADGEYRYRLDGDTLTIEDRQGEAMQVEHYVRGDLGLRLGDTPPREGAGGQGAQAQGAQPQDAQAPNASGIERLNAQDRAVYDRMRAALDRAPGPYAPEQRYNIAAAGLAEFKRRETLVQQPQDIGVYGDRLFVTYFPHGRDREPSFYANVRLDDAANAPARDSLQHVDTLNRERVVVAPPPQVEQGREQAPAMSARGL